MRVKRMSKLEALNMDTYRVLIFKQTRSLPCYVPGGPECDYYIHCIYDFKNACFVDESGNCVYVGRDQINADHYCFA